MLAPSIVLNMHAHFITVAPTRDADKGKRGGRIWGGVHLLATVRKYLASTLTKQGGRVSESVAWMDVEFQQKCFHPRGSFFYVYERTWYIKIYPGCVWPFLPYYCNTRYYI